MKNFELLIIFIHKIESLTTNTIVIIIIIPGTNFCAFILWLSN